MNATSASGPKWSKLTWLKSLRGADLTDSEYRVLTTLATYTGRDGRNAFPGNARLANDCLMQPRSVRRIIARLEAKGYLVLTNRGGNRYGKGRANVYGIVPRPEAANGAKGDQSSQQGGPANTASLTDESSHQGMHQAMDHSEDESSGSTPVSSLSEWDDMIDDFDALEEWLDDGTIDYDAIAASTALGMWEDGRHPLAIRNTIRKRGGGAA